MREETAIRCLTVKQPFSDLIISGRKTVENRTKPPTWWDLPEWWVCPICERRVAGRHQCESGAMFRPTNSTDRDGPYPFRLAIHAAQKPVADSDELLRVADELGCNVMGLRGWMSSRLGVILGTVEVTGSHHADRCDHICPEAGCDYCGDPSGHCGHTESWPALDPASEGPSDQIPCAYDGAVEGARRPCNNHCSPWAEPDCHHWELANPRPLDDPIPHRGQQGLWRLDDDVADQLRAVAA